MGRGYYLKLSVLMIAVAVAAAWVGWTLRDHETSTATMPMRGQVTDMDMRTQVAGQVRRQPGPSLSPTPAGVDPASPGSVFAKPTDPADVQRERDRLLAELERAHRAQPIDAAWAGTTEPALRELVTNDGIVMSGLDPQSYRADCRSDTCEITATFSAAADAEDWGMMYMTLTGKEFSRTRSMVIPQADGSGELRIYGYRRR